MKYKTGEKLFLLAIILIGVILFYGSSIVRVVFAEPITAKLYGQVISGIMIALCIARFIKLQLPSPKSSPDKKLTIPNFNIIVTQAFLMALYTLGITKLGYFVTTFFYLFIMIALLSDNKTIKSRVTYAIGSAVFTVVLYYIFKAFNIFLPNTLLI
jgi:hypothetical protein